MIHQGKSVYLPDKVALIKVPYVVGPPLEILGPACGLQVLSNGSDQVELHYDTLSGGLAKSNVIQAREGSYFRPFERLFVVMPATEQQLRVDGDLHLLVHKHLAGSFVDRGPFDDGEDVIHHPVQAIGVPVLAGASLSMLALGDLVESTSSPFDTHRGYHFWRNRRVYLDGVVKVTGAGLTAANWSVRATTVASHTAQGGSTPNLLAVIGSHGFAAELGAAAGTSMIAYLGQGWDFATAGGSAAASLGDGRLHVPIADVALTIVSAEGVQTGTVHSLFGWRSR